MLEDRLGLTEGSHKHRHHKRFVIKQKELQMDVASFDDEDDDIDIEDDVRRTFVVRKPYCWHARCMRRVTCMAARVSSVF